MRCMHVSRLTRYTGIHWEHNANFHRRVDRGTLNQTENYNRRRTVARPRAVLINLDTMNRSLHSY